MKALTLLAVFFLSCGAFLPTSAAEFSPFQLPPADTARARRLLDEAKLLLDSARFDAALEKLDAALGIFGQLPASGDLLRARALHLQGRCFFEKDEYDRAEKCFREALQARQNAPAADPLATAASLDGLGRALYAKGSYEQALDCHRQALDIRKNTLGGDDPLLAVSFDRLGNVFDSQGDFSQAADHYRLALGIRLKTLPAQHPDLASSFHNLGNTCSFAGDFDGALENYRHALEIWQAALDPADPNLAACHSGIGQAFMYMGDYTRAAQHQRTALDILLRTLEFESPRIAHVLNDFGFVFDLKGDLDRAMEHYRRALEIRLKTLPPSHPDLADSFNNLGIIHFLKNDFDQAEAHFQKALDIRLAAFGEEHPATAGSFTNLAGVFEKKGDFRRALEFHRKTLDIWTETLGEQHPDVAATWANIGSVFAAAGDWAQAAEHFKKALAIEQPPPAAALCLTSLFEACGKLRLFAEGEPLISQSLDALRYGGASTFQQVEALPVLIKTLAAKGNFYRDFYAATQERHHLLAARQAFSEALAAIAWQRLHLENPGSKSALAAESVAVVEGGIRTSFLLHRLTDSLHYWLEAFDLAEKSKSLLLLESMREADALHFAGIPDSLLEKERNLRVDIAWLEKKHWEKISEGLPETDSAALHISGKLFDLNRHFEQLKRRFETDFPEYFRLKHDLQAVTVGQAQQLLRPGQTLLEYFVGDSSIFIFTVGREAFSVHEVKKDFPLEEWVRQFRQSAVENYATAAADYADVAFRLFEKLVLPVRGELSADLVIVPDGALCLLPFEALLSEKPSKPLRFKTHRYLLRDFTASYCPSAALLREMQQKRHRQAPQKSLLAFAPYFDGDTTLLAAAFPQAEFRKDLQPLRHSGAEVAGAQKLLGGDVFYGKDATEERFEQSAADYRILHLATHGKASGEADYSFLAFSELKDSLENELLFVRELYNLPLNADLVALSACETGAGKLERGEGVISLARAFTFAGAKSLVATLWSVQDESTSELMPAFYQNLKKGMTKDAALRQAKLAFISKSDPAAGGAHPFFWAGVVAVGDMEPLFSGK